MFRKKKSLVKSISSFLKFVGTLCISNDMRHAQFVSFPLPLNLIIILDSSNHRRIPLLLQETMDLKMVFILVSLAAFSQGLKCHEGGLISDSGGKMFNATMEERECPENDDVCIKRM